MMTLDEAIKHAEEVAKEQDKLCKRCDDASGYSRSHNEDIRTTDAKRCEKCAEDHRQIAKWLKDYKRLLEQEPCDLLIIKSDKYLHPDDRKKWMEKIKREKESGVIILPPCFEPLLVPNDIEIRIEQEPNSDAISRQAVLDTIGNVPDHDDGMVWEALSHAQRDVALLPPVTQQPKTGHWIRMKAYEKWGCSECNTFFRFTFKEHDYCPNCGAKMQESEKK